MGPLNPARPLAPAPAEPRAPEPAEPAIDVRRLLDVLVHRKWIILGVAAMVLGLVAARTLREPRIYTASVSLVIELQAPRVLGDQVQDVEGSSAGFWQTKDFLETQFRILKSDAVSERVVRKLALDRDPDFLGTKDRQAMQEADAVALLRSRLRVDPERDSRVVNVRVDDRDPKKAALLANTIADEFIQFNLTEKLGTSRSASEWLHDQVDELQGKLAVSESNLYRFKRENDILTASLEDSQSMVARRLSALNDALTKIREQRAELSAKVHQVREARASGALSSLPQVVASPLIQAERTRAQLIGEEIAEARTRYGPDHPKLLALEEKHKAALATIAREEESIARAAEIEERQVADTEGNLTRLWEGVKREAFEVNKKEVDYSRLRREQENNAKIVELVMRRLKDVELASLLRTNNVRLLDAAKTPLAPTSPNLRLALMIGLGLGLLAGLGGAFLLEQLDNTVKGQEDLERTSRAAFLGIIPAVREGRRGRHFRSRHPLGVGQTDLFIHKKPKSTVSECLRTVRTNLLFLGTERPLTRLLVTSSGPQEGKTTAVIDLGITFAQSGQRVLLVDTDMRRPRLHKAFGLSNDLGLSSVLLDEKRLGEALRATEVPNLSVLACGPIPPNPAELLHTERFKALVVELSRRYDLILFDSPPIAAVTDAMILSSVVDGVVLLVKAGKTSKDAVVRARRALSDVQARVVGALLNAVDLGARRAGYYYADYAHYSYYGEKDDEAAG
jgi:capsular exopolysaccharide synthesis family protein